MNVGLDTNWRLNNAELYATPYIINPMQQQSQPVNLESNPDTFIASGKETTGCTDGKDDGKIGFWSALGNATKGVVNTVKNGIKGMFTNSEGKFSLGKTLLSVAGAAACIAFPAVGLVACAVGGTMGAIQVGKGIYNAATADTDAEAKQAWQDVGGGAFTVAASVAGAKAGVKAVQNSAGSASALSQLDDAATIGQKAVALGKDMVTSTKNSAKNVTSLAKQAATTAKGKLKNAKTKANEVVNNGKSAIKDVKAAYSESPVGKAEAALKAAKAGGNTDDIAAAEAALKNAKAQAKQQGKEIIMEIVDDVKTKAKTKTGEIAADIKNNVTKENAAILWNKMKSNIKNIDFKQISGNLKGTAKNIINELQNSSSSYAQVVQKYGFENVAQVLKYLAGSGIAENTI